MHALSHAVGAIFGDAKKFDAVAQFLGIGQIDWRDMADPFDMNIVEIHRAAKRQGRQNGQLVGGVDAVHVKGWIGLGVAKPLGLLKDIVKVAARLAHHG